MILYAAPTKSLRTIASDSDIALPHVSFFFWKFMESLLWYIRKKIIVFLIPLGIDIDCSEFPIGNNYLWVKLWAKLKYEITENKLLSKPIENVELGFCYESKNTFSNETVYWWIPWSDNATYNMLNVDAVFAIACIVDRREDKIGSVLKKNNSSSSEKASTI